MLALTGSTGALGGLVAPALANLRPRLIVRDPTRAPRLGLEVRTATYADGAAATAALEGVEVLLMVSAAESDRRREEHRTFIAAAVRAGVRHVVYTSFVGAAPDATFALARDHHDAEAALREAHESSGTAFTLLRDNFYLDVLPSFAGPDGALRGPAGDGAVAAVARADVADVLVAVLREPAAHAGATYTLTGPEALTLDDVAERAGAVLGLRLRYEPETVEEAWASRRAAYPDAPDWQLDAWVSTYTAIADGSCAAVCDDVRRLTGHAPRTLEQALRPR
ncbi:NAD(P)H-binding protein [Nocardioides rubriscoriae]|uniref:NAD(P)H-binding protein n=1 Tax=Nocardioides rubriscoriae TaxID=642762 RepID=UPI0011E03ED1|nr:NAD(P)H-binding protein [Nocardioides rubriscoriae]